MKLTIDNLDGKGAVDYSGCVVATAKFIIKRQLNVPSLCTFTVAPSVANLPMPARNGRLIVADDNGTILFTGYLPMEPALELVGQCSEGAVVQGVVSAISDEILLDQQPLPLLLTSTSQSSSEIVQGLSAGLKTAGFSFSLSNATGTVGSYHPDIAMTWSSNAGAVAAMSRSTYRAVNGVILMQPIGSVVHTLSEADGTLNVAGLQASMVKALANDITVCGQDEPAAYVTEYFQGDGTTTLFQLTEEPYMPPASRNKPFIELFEEPQVDPAIWQVVDTGSRISLTSAGLTCTGGNGADGGTTVSTINGVELGGSVVFEAGGVLFGSITEGILNGIYAGSIQTSNCVAGFQISQANGSTQITALIDGSVSGTPFAVVSGHMYTLRLRVYCNEEQRATQAYMSIDATGQHTYGGFYLAAGGSLMLEVQDTTGEVAAEPVILYSGSISNLPAVAPAALLNSTSLDCSIARFEVSQHGPVWVVNTPPNGNPTVRRLGTVAQGADCRMERLGKVLFYPTSIPQAGEQIAVCYRTRNWSVARFANSASITQESNGGLRPGTSAWIGTVTGPAARSSVDCENAASALMDFATDRGAAWQGKYTAWNLETQGDVWPGDVLAVSSTSASMSANLVARTVELELSCTWPGLVKYVISFANDWADALAIKTSARVPADVWLPQQPATAVPLANLNGLEISSVTSSAITVNAVVTPPTNGGFEVRRKDWVFGPGTDSDLVLRSPVNSFTIPREAVMERYYIRMYDGSTPPNYSRFSTAVFVNIAM